MNEAARSGDTTPANSRRLRDRAWRRFLRGPDNTLLEELYVPALQAARRYDRCCAYFSSSVLAAAARGFAGLIETLIALGDAAPRPSVRLLVNEELAPEDVTSLTEAGDTSVLETALRKRFKTPKEVLERQRLEVLAWLAKAGFLDMRVGVMRFGAGILHAKFGIVTDAGGDAVVFNGSGNESASGLLANYERLEVSTSWDDPERHQEYVTEFETLWQNRHSDVATYPLPEALRLKLVKIAPPDPPTVEPANALPRQKAAMLWRYLIEAPYLQNGASACDATAMVDVWPHQRSVVEEVSAAWPDGRLLCDEVGMGKTIEAILVLRRLLAGRGVRRVLLLVPANLLKQWQGELREKGGLIVPRLEGTTALIWPDGRQERVDALATALTEDLLLMSRETARTENNLPVLLAAQPWDLVLLDEAHAARRASQVEGEFNSATLLLELLRQLQLQRKTRSILLLSATPMQTHPWEPWDLLAVLGEGGLWLSDFRIVRDFYVGVSAIERGPCRIETARAAARTIVADPLFPSPPVGVAGREADKIAQSLAFAPAAQRPALAHWMRQGAPLARRMHRNTRQTLRSYYEKNLLDRPPPVRRVADRTFDFADPPERAVYQAITGYIDRRFAELEGERPGKGFVMTVYRRRAASSFEALQRSLERRREALRQRAEQRAVGEELDDQEDGRLDLDELSEFEASPRVSAALPDSPAQARQELGQVEGLLDQLRGLHGRDSKRDFFYRELERIADDGRSILVFTCYADTMVMLREALQPKYGSGIGSYSGDGGHIWLDGSWQSVPKDTVTRALAHGHVRTLICTDAASEGLNLQAAGAVINYDLPWNPSRVEQRIGRIDRIGQRHADVRIVNLFLRDSVDETVYRALHHRCQLFERFVGPMQPVLARARRFLLGQEMPDAHLLDAEADTVEGDVLIAEAYRASEAEEQPAATPPVSRTDMVAALELLDGSFGPKAKKGKNQLWQVTGIDRPIGADTTALESEPKAIPLSPLAPEIRRLPDSFARPGERLPLVIAAAEQGSFRAAVAYWVAPSSVDTLAPRGAFEEVRSFAELRLRTEAWDGTYPEAAAWLATQGDARKQASARVTAMARQATAAAQRALNAQVAAARHRLIHELGRYLVCAAEGADNLNAVLHALMSEHTASAERLYKAYERLGGYPEWDPVVVRDLQDFRRKLAPSQVKARLIGSELDAALADPRWRAAQ